MLFYFVVLVYLSSIQLLNMYKLLAGLTAGRGQRHRGYNHKSIIDFPSYYCLLRVGILRNARRVELVTVQYSALQCAKTCPERHSIRELGLNNS